MDGGVEMLYSFYCTNDQCKLKQFSGKYLLYEFKFCFLPWVENELMSHMFLK